jgi:hypothetical protein
MSNQISVKHHVEPPSTFFNQALLKENPFTLRDELFGSHRDPKDIWALVDSLICAIEHEARKVLKQNPPPFYAEELLDGLTKDQSPPVWNLFGHHRNAFTHQQANAVAALRSIGILRRQFPDPSVSDQVYDSAAVGKIVMEAVALLMAAFRGEFWTSIWPNAQKNMIRVARNKQNSPLANEAKKRRAEEVAKWCREWARQYYLDREMTIKAAARKTRQAFKEKRTEEPPSHATIMRYIRELFTERTRTRKKLR